MAGPGNRWGDSPDGGAVVVGNSGSSAPRAFRWTPQGTVYLSQYRGSAQAVTPDGRFCVIHVSMRCHQS